MNKDIQILLELGYRVIEKNEGIHYHVFFGDTFINLWPTGKKFMPKVSCPSTEYEDIQEVIDYMKSKDKTKLVEEHQNFLENIKNKINKK